MKTLKTNENKREYSKKGLKHLLEYIKDNPQDSHDWKFNNGIEYALEQLKLNKQQNNK